MLQAEYVVEDNINELDLIKLISLSSRFLNKSLNLTIAVTLDCNMNCPYCYEDKSNLSMTEEIQDSLCDFIENYLKTNNCTALNITWYGGEPLLEKDLIYRLSERFIEITKKLKVGYGASIVTNGFMLDSDCAEHLKNKCNVNNAQLTIDGPSEIHNNRRILINGNGSFETIINNIENCKSFLNISVRINVDKDNIDSIENLIDYFTDVKNWGVNPRFYIAPVKIYNDNSIYDISTCFSNSEFEKIRYFFF